MNVATQPCDLRLDTPVSDRAWAQAHQLNALGGANRLDTEYECRLLREEAIAAWLVDEASNSLEVGLLSKHSLGDCEETARVRENPCPCRY